MKNNFKKKVLSNGMTVLFEKRDLPIVSVAFAVRNGGINESLDEKGISHFIEHMLYKGTPTRNWKQISDSIEKNGGKMNAFTSEEMVAYWCKLPSEKLNVALDVLSDIIKNPLFDKNELEKERKVIFEEIKMHHDNPLKYVFEEIQKLLYSGTLEIDLGGTVETMNSIDQDKIVDFFKKSYQPDQMIFCVVGDADFGEVIRFADDTFGEKKSNVSEQEISLKNEVKIEERTGIDQANLVFAYHVPLAGEDGSFVAEILNALMAGGLSSRLLSEIREKRNLAYAVEGASNINKKYAYNFVYVGTMKENVEKVKDLILNEFKKVSKDFSEKELEEVKQQLIGHHQISMEDSQTQMINLLSSELHGNAEDHYDFEEKIRAVRLEEVKEMASKVKEGNYSFFALVPEN